MNNINIKLLSNKNMFARLGSSIMGNFGYDSQPANDEEFGEELILYDKDGKLVKCLEPAIDDRVRL